MNEFYLKIDVFTYVYSCLQWLTGTLRWDKIVL